MTLMNFEEWLRTVCFQEPTAEAKDLAKCAWDRQQSRIAELEAGLRDAADTIASFDGLIGYGTDCDEKIARYEALLGEDA